MPPFSLEDIILDEFDKDGIDEIDIDGRQDEFNNNDCNGNHNNNTIKLENKEIETFENEKGWDSANYTSRMVKSSSTGQSVRYIYNIGGPQIVWRNVFLFLSLHLIYIYSYYVCIANKCWITWIFSYWYGLLGGLGVTAGSHRLWSHRSYKAKLPLRIFLCFCQSIAGQNHLYEWCRDHRVHHKYSETDADPHNSKRGFFFAHVGWLLTRKHPAVIEKGKALDFSDLLKDPVIRIQKRFYIWFYLFFCFVLPWWIPVYFWGENWFNSLIVSVLWRYCTSLHCTWFVNSAAHMWGDRPYKSNIQPRENEWVSFGAFGEGFHNYHHTFPWDYSTSEMGWRMNVTTMFIDLMAYLGQAYDMRQLSPQSIRQRKKKVLEEAMGGH